MVAGVINKSWPGRRARRAILPCVLAAQAALVGAAHASCGDWLQHPTDSPPARMIASLDDAVAAQAPVDPASRSVLPPGRPEPCDGPHCRQAPGVPAPAAPVVIVDRVERLGLAAEAIAAEVELLPLGRVYASRVRASRGFLPRIEHPPRV